jgi:hypothetical protein
MTTPANRLLTLVIPALLVLLLPACIDDTPYSNNYAHILIAPEGPGQLVMETRLMGETICGDDTGDSICAHTVYLQDDEVLTITAIPDEGHTFTGWVRAGSPNWTDELQNNSNPLFLLADGDYFFQAAFR